MSMISFNPVKIHINSIFGVNVYFNRYVNDIFQSGQNTH